MTMFDLGPAAAQVRVLADGVRDEQFDRPTPNPEWSVRVLLDHLTSLAQAFTDGARKKPRHDAPKPTGDLPEDWRDQLHARLDDLVEAWRDPAAWAGEATVGGGTLPADLTAAVVADELVVHGWDLARATGQPYEPDAGLVRASLGFAEQFADMEGGPFGPSRPAPDGASDLDRLLSLTGRSPDWTAPA
jgi:uncharacterized protein (TIGR03086 family)